MSNTRERRLVAIRTALRQLGDSASIATERSGATLGLVVPTTHPRFAEMCRLLLNGQDLHFLLMGAERTQAVEEVEEVREFLAARFLIVKGPAAAAAMERLSELHGEFNTTRADPISRGRFASALRALNVPVSGDVVRGLVDKAEALSDHWKEYLDP